MFEDAPVGVEAALAAGCPCVGVTMTVGRDELAKADVVVDSLAELEFTQVEALGLRGT